MGGSYEVQTDGTTETVRQYYAIAGVTAGMREGSTFYYFLTDHLGSVVGVTDSSGMLVSQTRYAPFGAIRTDIGIISQTDYGYTFQRNVSGMGLMDYKARAYDPYLNHWIQPDTIIPDPYNPQSWNRYSYVNGNPINHNDPSGHSAECILGSSNGCLLYAGLNQMAGFQGMDDNSANVKYLTSYLKRNPKIVNNVTPIKQILGTSCGEATFTMAYNLAFPDNKRSEDEIIRGAEEGGLFDRYTFPFTSPDNMNGLARYYGISFSSGNVTNESQGLAQLILQLDAGKPVMVDSHLNFVQEKYNTHFILITGLSVDQTGILVNYNDPYYGENKTSLWDKFLPTWLENKDRGGKGWWMTLP
jgi:RHS repeat-associated protein